MSATGRRGPLPPHRSLIVPGLHAYADQLSVCAGDDISFHVSSTVAYDFSLRQLGRDPDSDSMDVVLGSWPDQPAAPQAIHPGSYIAVDKPLATEALEGITVECWVKPWDFGDHQAVIAQCGPGEDPGFALAIDARGRLCFTCGHSTLTAREPLSQQWQHIAATLFRGAMTLFVNGVAVARGLGPSNCKPARAPLRIGAGGRDGVADDFLDADIAMPAIHGRLLGSAEILARFDDGAQHPPDGAAVLGCWPLSEQRGEEVRDISGCGRNGRLVNHGTWMVPGPRFDPARVPRFSDQPHYAPELDPMRGHALRVASDDMVDCGWAETHRVSIPESARPGIYVGRFDFMQDGERMAYEVSFVVKRATAAAAAPMLVLCATNTWLAYSASPFARNQSGATQWPRQGKGLPSGHPLAPDYNHYTRHRKGQPNYYVGLRMPRPNSSPRAYYAPEGSGFSQWVRLERHLHTWLDERGYEYDMVSDFDLHRHPQLLAPYRCVVVCGHSEYWSRPAVEGLDSYLAAGGNAVVLSGNTMYWRVSFDEDGCAMEQRKTETPMPHHEAPQARHAAPGGVHGEQYHSQDGARGGLWRFNGRSSSDVIGLETAGWAFAAAEDFGVYRVRQPGHFLFHTPLETGLRDGATFGHGPDGRLPRAVGHEWDLTIATLQRVTKDVPGDAEMPTPQPGISVLAEGIRPSPGLLDAYMDFFERPVKSLDGLSAEMIYWERPAGGRVFNAGAVAAAWVLHEDPAFASLLANVLAHFGIPLPGSASSTMDGSDIQLTSATEEIP